MRLGPTIHQSCSAGKRNMKSRAWPVFAMWLCLFAWLNRMAFQPPLDGLLLHKKGAGVVLARASTPVAPTSRERNSVHQLAMGRQLSINLSTAEQLETVPHIGPFRAIQIVINRRENGNFSSIGDLKRVRGIGPRTVQKVAPYLTL